MEGPQLRNFDFEAAEIGEELGSLEYVLTQEMLDNFRASVDDPEAPFPTIAAKHDGAAKRVVYEDEIDGGVNARAEIEFYRPPVPGRKIRVTGRIVDKYWRRGKPYLVTEGTAFDEDGNLLEIVRTYHMRKPDEMGKKWQPESGNQKP